MQPCGYYRKVFAKPAKWYRYIRYYTWVKHRVKMTIRYTADWGPNYSRAYNRYRGNKYTFVDLDVDGKQGCLFLYGSPKELREKVDLMVFLFRNQTRFKGGNILHLRRNVKYKTEEELQYKFDKLLYMKKKFNPV